MQIRVWCGGTKDSPSLRLADEEDEETTQTRQCPVRAAAQGWLARGAVKRERWYESYDTDELQQEWEAYPSGAKLPKRGRYGSVGAVANELSAESKRTKEGRRYKFDVGQD